MCFWCDVVDNTSAAQDTNVVSYLTQQYINALSNPEHVESDLALHTITYGLGQYGYLMSKEAFAPHLERASTLMKGITRREEAFSEENMEATENAMGAILKLCYRHIDGNNLKEEDLVGVLGMFPFKEDECEA